MFQKGQRITVVNGDFSYTGVVAEDTPLMSPVQTLRLEDDRDAVHASCVHARMKSIVEALDAVMKAN